MALLIAPNLPATAAARATFTSMEALEIRSVAVLELRNEFINMTVYYRAMLSSEIVNIPTS